MFWFHYIKLNRYAFEDQLDKRSTRSCGKGRAGQGRLLPPQKLQSRGRKDQEMTDDREGGADSVPGAGGREIGDRWEEADRGHR